MAGKVEGKNKYSILNCDVVDGILSLLDALQTTPRGRVIYQQVEHAMRDLTVSQNKIAYGYAHILNLILESYRKHLPVESLLYLELKMVQKRWMPPISLNELAILHSYIKNVMRLTKDVIEPDEALIREAMLPLTGLAVPAEKENDENQNGISGEQNKGVENVPTINVSADDMSPSVEIRVNSIFRERLNKHYQEIQNLQSSLSGKISNTIEQYENFGPVLESTLRYLEQTDEKYDVEEIKQELSVQVKTLLNSRTELAKILNDTQAYLSLINDNSQKLSEELDQVRVLSLTDDLTELPNRRAFLRRAADEMGRADRDKTSLALVAIDLDYFKNINDKYGHAVGDEILKLYAKDVLSIFRRYDMVSRYGGEEFSVLLPNTDKNGALRALKKIQTKVANTHYIYEGESIALPTFSSGLVIHRPGELIEKFIERADKVLYKAKQMGRNRVEIDGSYPDETVDTSDEPLAGNKSQTTITVD